MKFLRPMSLFAVLAASAQPVPAADIVACVVADNIQGNGTYYGMATTVTRLKCEFTNEEYFPTMGELYRQGWRLLEVVGGDHALSMGNRGPSPLYFFERERTPAPAAAQKKENAPAPAKKK